MRSNFIISFICLIALQLVLQFVLIYFNVPSILISIICDLVFSLVFALLDFRGKEKLKNPAFHKTFAIYFLVLTLLSVIFGVYKQWLN